MSSFIWFLFSFFCMCYDIFVIDVGVEEICKYADKLFWLKPNSKFIFLLCVKSQSYYNSSALKAQRFQLCFKCILCFLCPEICLREDKSFLSLRIFVVRVAEVAREHGWHPPKSLDSDKNFKPEHTLFCRELRFVAIYALFLEIFGQKECLFG